jgi:hypothetical protein
MGHFNRSNPADYIIIGLGYPASKGKAGEKVVVSGEE